MTARLLDGASVARRILDDVGRDTAAFMEMHGRPPGLAVVLVGNDPASEIYVGRKKKESDKRGIHSEVATLPGDSTTEQILAVVDALNDRAEIDGVLVQLPLPAHVDRERVIERIAPDKDVDGLHPLNVGLLVRGKPRLAPCTPAGVMELLDAEGIAVAGMRAVIVGRSDIVGKPLALMLLHRHATVTICHSRTASLSEVCAEGDLLVGATGRPAMITGEFIKPGAVVIDVGMSRLKDRDKAVSLFGEGHANLKRFERAGYALIGDVHPRQGLEKAGALTPVPGGVGPLTIAMLMKNTLRAAALHVSGGA